MKSILTLLSVGILACNSIAGNDNSTIKYQGKLLDGTNLVSGTVQIVVRIYTNATSGEYFFEETNSVNVVDGFYSIALGKKANYGQLKEAVKLSNAHIQLIVNGNYLYPREPFNPPPFAQSSTAHWRLFGGIHPDNAGYVSTYNDLLAATNLLARTLGWYTLGTIKEFAIGGPMYPCFRTAVFPPPADACKIKQIQFCYQNFQDYDPTFTNTAAIIVRVRDLFTEDEKRILASDFPMSDAVPKIWHSISLTNSQDLLYIQPNEVLEVYLFTKILGSKAGKYMGVFLDVEVE